MLLPKTLEHNGQRILITAQLAEAYGTTAKRISENFSENSERYTENKHYYCLTGEQLKAFKNESGISGIAKTINKLYLWTEYGALLHAKSLNTDKAWEVYSFLVENYFNPVQIIQKPTSQLDILSGMIDVMKQQEERLKAVEENGCTPTQANHLCNLDVIAEDAKLKEIYIGILRDMRFKAGV